MPNSNAILSELLTETHSLTRAVKELHVAAGDPTADQIVEVMLGGFDRLSVAYSGALARANLAAQRPCTA